ncbi:MAG: hypothetical protein JJ891_12645 [Rhizobiaceae bacterium]|nr:hypothetical protein [Rhizobiaceae bacterium]
MKKFLFSLITVSAAIFASASVAETNQTAQLTQDIDTFVTSHAGEFVDDKLTPEQVVHMKLIAHQAAVAATCEDFTLSEEKFLAAFSGLAHTEEADMDDAQKAYFEKHLLVTYGIMVGGALAVAAPDPAGFCADAEDERSDPAFSELSIWQ